MALTSQQYDGEHPLIYKQRCSHHSILVLGAIEKLQISRTEKDTKKRRNVMAVVLSTSAISFTPCQQLKRLLICILSFAVSTELSLADPFFSFFVFSRRIKGQRRSKGVECVIKY
jgi:hypothetical protein